MTGRQYQLAAAAVYLVTMTALVLGLFRARVWVAQAYGDRGARSQWQTYREDMASQATDTEAPVRRRAPKSVEPPALVLMRDYFSVCLALALVLSSALFATLALLVGGVLIKGRDERTDEARK
jgi:hypothetical protein